MAHAIEGRGLIKVNGSPVNLIQPHALRYKIFEPVLVVGEAAFSRIDIRVRVSGGGQVSQIYAIRQAISKALVAFYAKYEDAAEALSLKKALVAYDRTLLVADPRRMEPKKFGGHGARARRQKRSAAKFPSLVLILIFRSTVTDKLFVTGCWFHFARCHLSASCLLWYALYDIRGGIPQAWRRIGLHFLFLVSRC